jgi:hypothetical protein
MSFINRYKANLWRDFLVSFAASAKKILYLLIMYINILGLSYKCQNVQNQLPNCRKRAETSVVTNRLQWCPQPHRWPNG